MACVYDPTDPDHLTPDQRLDELARLLATGIRRALASGQQIPTGSSQIGLDVPPEKSIHASHPVNATGDEGRS